MIQPQKLSKKREKIFIDIYSSYLQMNGASSPARKAFAETEKTQEEDLELMLEDQLEDVRELTPIRKAIPTGKMKDNQIDLGRQISQDPHQGAKKLGHS